MTIDRSSSLAFKWNYWT